MSLGYAVEYVGRDASASPATGSLTVHKQEQNELVEAAIHGPYPHLVRAGTKAQPVAEDNGDNGAAHEHAAVAVAK